MPADYFTLESNQLFSKSLIWQLNRDFYHQSGILAWSDDIVPHHMTSSSKVGKTYAELLFGILKDTALKNNGDEPVYIMEMGAGHGRLAFHILYHLEKLLDNTDVKFTKYCYILSDIVEDNLSFFDDHPQLQRYFQSGILETAYFNASESQEIILRKSQRTINPGSLQQPMVAIGNYFFDSLANDLFYIENKTISNCSVTIKSKENPKEATAQEQIKNMEISYHKTAQSSPFYEDPVLNEMLENYRDLLKKSYLFFPEKAIKCIRHLRNFSKKGLVLLTMDKGFHEARDIMNKPEPDIVTHGSFSFWVNYHAFNLYCKNQGGKALFPSFSNFHLEIGCLLFLPESDTYSETHAAYEQFVNNFGPDDFNSLKRMAYFNLSRLKLTEMIALYRLSAYDATFFIKLLPRLKHVTKTISFNERKRIAQTLHQIWGLYFNINEPLDLAYELGGLFYDLGFYAEALTHFQYSVDSFGTKADTFYNQALCHYQLKEDALFYKTLGAGKTAFPEYPRFGELEKLDMS